MLVLQPLQFFVHFPVVASRLLLRVAACGGQGGGGGGVVGGCDFDLQVGDPGPQLVDEPTLGLQSRPQLAHLPGARGRRRLRLPPGPHGLVDRARAPPPQLAQFGVGIRQVRLELGDARCEAQVAHVLDPAFRAHALDLGRPRPGVRLPRCRRGPRIRPRRYDVVVVRE